MFDHKTVGTKSSDHIWIDVEIKGRALSMELDTGSGVSIISKSSYDEMFSDLPIHPTTVVFETYTGQKRKSTAVNYKSQRYILNLYVVKCDGPPLLGREWLKYVKLDW